MYGKRVQDRRLENGARVILHSTPSPDVGFGIFIPFGYQFEEPKEVGVTHLLEHVVFRKNDLHHYREINRLMKRYGAQGRFEAETRGTHALYFARVLPRDFLPAWKLLSSMVFRSTFPPYAVIREKKIVAQELTDLEEDPMFLADRALITTLFPTHPARNDVLENPTATQKLDRATILARYREHYRPSHATAVFVGNVPSSQVFDAVGELFDSSSLPRALPVFTEEKAPRAHNVRIKRQGIGKSFIMFGFRAPSIRDTEFPAMRIVEYLLVRGFDSPLKQFVREQTGHAYNTPDQYQYSHCHGLFSIGALVFPRDVATVAKLMSRSIRYVQQGVTQENFRLNRRALLNDLEISKGSVVERIHSIGEAALLEGPTDVEFLKKVKRVTRDEVVEVARKFLNLQESVEVIVKPE